jgi:cytoskeleton protein RodZ
MSELAPTLGQRLKAERQRRGMSTQKAADEMHLDAWVIDALEADDYQRIGPSVYAKGHLKKYASILGMSPAEIVAGYDTRPAAPVVVAPQPASIRMHSTAPGAANLPWPQIAAFALLVLTVGGILWWRPWHPRSVTPASVALNSQRASAASPGTASISAQPNIERSPEQQASNNATSEPDVAAGASAEAPPPAAAAATPAALSRSAGTASETDSTLGVGRARLRLSFSADSWVDVRDAAGRRVFTGNGRANSVKTIAGMAPLRVYLGFAGGVQLEVNDHAVAIGPQFVTGDVARFEAGADGVLRRDSHPLPSNGVQTRAAPPNG